MICIWPPVSTSLVSRHNNYLGTKAIPGLAVPPTTCVTNVNKAWGERDLGSGYFMSPLTFHFTDCVERRFPEHNPKELIRNLNQKCRDAAKSADAIVLD